MVFSLLLNLFDILLVKFRAKRCLRLAQSTNALSVRRVEKDGLVLCQPQV